MKLPLFWHKYSILNFLIGLTKLVSALSVWEGISRSFGYSSLINVKTGARRISCLYELSSVLRTRRRATKDYSSSRIMHLVPVPKPDELFCLFVCVCFFSRSCNLSRKLFEYYVVVDKSLDNAARFNMSSNSDIADKKVPEGQKPKIHSKFHSVK